jgi:Zn-dependent M28 family amino/carboxypeptidase
LWGSKRFAKKHHIELSNAYLVNLEMVGAGAMIAVAGERTAGAKHSQEVVSLITESARRCGITIPSVIAPFGETDAASFSRRGLKAATIATFDIDGVPPKWHVLGDTIENVDESHLRDALKVCIECVHTLEREA